MDYFASELISFSSSLMHVSFFYNLQLRYKVESSTYHMQLLLGAIVTTQRLNNVGATIESCGTHNLAVWKDEQIESTMCKMLPMR